MIKNGSAVRFLSRQTAFQPDLPGWGMTAADSGRPKIEAGCGSLPSRPCGAERERKGRGDKGHVSLERNGTVSRIGEIVLDQMLQQLIGVALFC